jgi:hypothetical protein
MRNSCSARRSHWSPPRSRSRHKRDRHGRPRARRQQQPPRRAPPTEYVVLYAKGASTEAAHAAIKAAGGTLVRENRTVGLATVRTSNRSFLNAVSGQRALVSAMANHAIGQLPGGKGQAKRDSVENDRCVNAAAKATAQTATSAARGRTASEPLSDKQWDMRQIDATPNGAYRVNQGKSGVMVGIIDPGIDGRHPTCGTTSTAG